MEIIDIDELGESEHNSILVDEITTNKKRTLHLDNNDGITQSESIKQKKSKRNETFDQNRDKIHQTDLENDSIIILGNDATHTDANNSSDEDLAAYEQIIEDSDIEIIENPISNSEEQERLRKEEEFANETPICIICYGEPTNAIVTECGHVYCCECIHEYRNKNFTTCAVCRKHYNDRNNHLVIMKSVLVPKLDS